ncbi:MAG: glycosyltransferase family 39 protein [Anaerolineales bacterium]|nr:glycosyltransferase family 39 protein [Anaerolineales bacterium]MDW8446388.1 glycosyltransferase family 39 protein [Anaerolineales bacterium]
MIKLKSLASPYRWIPLFLLALGAALRLYDLTDPPLDYHPSRQLRGAIIARSIYYQMLPDADPLKRELSISIARSTGRFEAPILETLAAYTYRLLGNEQLWVGRAYSILFWLIGAFFVYLIAKRATDPDAALFSLGYMLLLPFAVQGSRVFQPDPGMTMWIVISGYSLLRWQETLTWRWALLASATSGMAVLTKPVAGYIVFMGALLTVLSRYRFNRALRSLQIWVMASVMAAIPGTYYLSNRQDSILNYYSNWTASLTYLLKEPSFYVRWISFLSDLVGFSSIVLGLLGIWLTSSTHFRSLLIGWWIGYFLYGTTVPYQIYTHSYYSLQLVPILALSLAPVAEVLRERLSGLEGFWRWSFAFWVVFVVAYPAWISITTARAEDHRTAPQYWAQIGALLPPEGKIIALTQSYGYPLMYYGWRKVTLWQSTGEQELAALRRREKDFEAAFTNRLEGMDYFLVTALNQFEAQKELKKALYQRYPLIAEGNGYLIFDLRHPLR